MSSSVQQVSTSNIHVKLQKYGGHQDKLRVFDVPSKEIFFTVDPGIFQIEKMREYNDVIPYTFVGLQCLLLKAYSDRTKQLILDPNLLETQKQRVYEVLNNGEPVYTPNTTVSSTNPTWFWLTDAKCVNKLVRVAGVTNPLFNVEGFTPYEGKESYNAPEQDNSYDEAISKRMKYTEPETRVDIQGYTTIRLPLMPTLWESLSDKDKDKRELTINLGDKLTVYFMDHQTYKGLVYLEFICETNYGDMELKHGSRFSQWQPIGTICQLPAYDEPYNIRQKLFEYTQQGIEGKPTDINRQKVYEQYLHNASQIHIRLPSHVIEK